MSYTRWLLASPINLNFSFSDDSDLDGLADNWTNTGATVYSISDSEHRYHVQYYKEGTLSQLTSVTPSNPNNYRVFFEIKTDGDVIFYVKTYIASVQREGGYFYSKTINSTTWTSELIELLLTDADEIEIGFVCGAGISMWIDNVAVVEYTTSFILNPSKFKYNLKSNATYETSIDNSKIIIENTNRLYTVELSDYIWESITYTERVALETLINENVIIKTHDNKIFNARVVDLTFDYDTELEGTDQRYNAKMELEYY